jgi:imidazolonepropionase-like amidohydrolase
MRRLVLLAACVPACGAPHAAHPTDGGARVTRFSVITVDRPAGDGEIRVDADGTFHSHFTFNDRGRGPDLTSVMTFDAHGALRTLHTTGHAYEKQPIDETLEEKDGKLAWHSTAEHGEAAAGAGFYQPLNEPLAAQQEMIRAALHAPGRKIALLPGGEQWIEDDVTLDVTLDGKPRHLREIATAGTAYTPNIWWIDEHEDLFAAVNPWTSIIQTGAESLIPQLVAADQKWMAARAAKLASTLAHKPPAAGLAFTHANVFDSEAKKIVPDRTVIVVGDRITAVGDAKTPIPAGAQVIDAHGRTLLPGLWDMHVHIGDGDGTLDLAVGVTTVRDLGNDIKDLGARMARFDDGTELGPRLLRAGLIDGPGKLAAPTGVLASTPDEALAAVKKYADLGYLQIKMYSSLDPKLVPIIAKAAHDRGLRVSGHIPNGMRASEAVEAGYDEIQHVNFLFLQFLVQDGDDTRTPVRFTRVAEGAAGLDLDGKDVQAFLDLLVAHHTVLDPTVATFEGMFIADPGELDPGLVPWSGRLPAQAERGAHGGGLDAPGAKRATFRASYAKVLDLVARAWKRGIPIVAGTDQSPSPLYLPRELELYVKAGIPAPEVLALDTIGAARVMHFDKDRGSIAVGKQADLVLVDGDPTRDISAVRKADVVVCRGVVYDPPELFRASGMH